MINALRRLAGISMKKEGIKTVASIRTFKGLAGVFLTTSEDGWNKTTPECRFSSQEQLLALSCYFESNKYLNNNTSLFTNFMPTSTMVDMHSV